VFGKRKQRGTPVPAIPAWPVTPGEPERSSSTDATALAADPGSRSTTWPEPTDAGGRADSAAAETVATSGAGTDATRAGDEPRQHSLPSAAVTGSAPSTSGMPTSSQPTASVPASTTAGSGLAETAQAGGAATDPVIAGLAGQQGPTSGGASAGGETGDRPTSGGGPDGDASAERAVTWAATWGIAAERSLPVVEDLGPSADGAEGAPEVGQTVVAPGAATAPTATTTGAAGTPPQRVSPPATHAAVAVPRETSSRDDDRPDGAPQNRQEIEHVTTGPTRAGDEAVAPLDLDPDEQRRAALVQSLPTASADTPLMAELEQDARRRIELRGRRFPRPAETRVVTVANQKGGVGKTTTTVNLAAALAQSGLNVLVLDNDPQGNASTALGIEHRAGTPSIYEVLVEGAPIAEAVQESPDVPNLWCLPATIDLSGAEIELVSMVARETRLRSALDTYLQWRLDQGMERIDYVFVDCPPSLGLLTVNAFVVAREVLIPIQCEYYALEGLSQLLKTIQLIQAHLNPDLHVSTILLTMYDARTNLAQQVASEVREHFPDRTLRTTVPRSVRISEAPSYGQTVMTYDAGSSGALAYLEAAREIAERGAETAPDGDTTSTSTPAERGAEEDR